MPRIPPTATDPPAHPSVLQLLAGLLYDPTADMNTATGLSSPGALSPQAQAAIEDFFTKASATLSTHASDQTVTENVHQGVPRTAASTFGQGPSGGEGGDSAGPRTQTPPPQGCIRRERTSEAPPEAVGQAVGGGCQSGWERLLSVTNASVRLPAVREIVAGHRLGTSWAPWRGGGGVYLPPFQPTVRGGGGVLRGWPPWGHCPQRWYSDVGRILVVRGAGTWPHNELDRPGQEGGKG